jgi:hypothetical protein
MGKLQLAVLTEHKIMPRELIIEHIPQNSELTETVLQSLGSYGLRSSTRRKPRT